MIQVTTALRLRAFLATALSALLIVACGGGGGGGGGTAAPPATAHRVSADVSGLRGAGLVLTLDQAEDVTVTGNGSISFARQIAAGQSFSLVVKTQPTGPAQYCTVEATVQPIESDTTVAVRCDFPPPKFVYVGTSTGIDVMRADAATGALAPVQTIDLSNANHLALTQDQSLLIAFNGSSGNTQLTTFRVDANTGELAPTQSAPFALGTFIGRIAVHANGSRVYVAQKDTNRIQSLRLDSVTGQLSSQSSVDVPSIPNDLAISPDGRFLYVVLEDGIVQTYAIDAAGALRFVEDRDTVISTVISLALDPQQRYLYVGGLVSSASFGLDPVAGTLSPSPISVVRSAGGLAAVHPSGDYLYTYDLANEVATLAVDAGTGELAPVGTKVPAGTSLSGLVAVGRFLVATSFRGDISMYTVDAATGQPALVGSTPTSSGARDVVISTQR